MFTPSTLEIAMVSFEGPDQYSQAGGLGVRAKEVCRSFASLGYTTTLYFIGDPGKPADEVVDGVTLVRCCQDVSSRYPAGVYDGEQEKLDEMRRVLPGLIVERTVRPALAAGKVVALLAEEWQTAELVMLLHMRLAEAGLRDRCVLLWNANNHFGFDGIDWRGLEHAATVTTVSRYMKHLMWLHGVNPMVVYNGIPPEALDRVDPEAVEAIRAAAGTPCLTFKIGRFSPDKRWYQGLDAIAELRAGGLAARLLMRGGVEQYGQSVLAHARHLGLSVTDWNDPIADAADVARALRGTHPAAVVNLRRFLPEAVLPAVAAASAAVLANSGHEPFGLVGLETMAAGGVAVVGATGEEYARPYGNAIVIETAEGSELASALRGLVERPDLSQRLRLAGRRDAADFAWPEVIDGFLERLRFVASRQHVPVPAADLSGADARATSARLVP
jgi:glycosyltransferase involved in cell wall biosynthesis